MKPTKYKKVKTLPSGAIRVPEYAKQMLTSSVYVCVKYDRFLAGKGSKPDYKIVNWMGINFVVKNKKP